MISLLLGWKGCKVLLSDLAFEREFGLEPGKVALAGSVRVESGQSSRWTAEEQSSVLELLSDLPCDPECSSDHLTLVLDGLL
jgi:hypothetical protein